MLKKSVRKKEAEYRNRHKTKKKDASMARWGQ